MRGRGETCALAHAKCWRGGRCGATTPPALSPFHTDLVVPRACWRVAPWGGGLPGPSRCAQDVKLTGRGSGAKPPHSAPRPHPAPMREVPRRGERKPARSRGHPRTGGGSGPAPAVNCRQFRTGSRHPGPGAASWPLPLVTVGERRGDPFALTRRPTAVSQRSRQPSPRLPLSCRMSRPETTKHRTARWVFMLTTAHL